MTMHMNMVEFGGIKIFRPAFEIEALIRERARAHLYRSFAPGVYRGATAANKLIKHQFVIYSTILDEVLPHLGIRSAVDFLLWQFDQASKLLHGRGISDAKERENWRIVEPLFKRSIKFIMERICLLQVLNDQGVAKEQAWFAMNTGVSCAEQMVHLSQESDLVHSVFPDHCKVLVFDSGTSDYNISIEGIHTGFADRFAERVRRDRNSRNEIVASPHFDIHVQTHQRHLDDAFTRSFGLSYGHFIAALRTVIEGCRPVASSPTLFVHRESVVSSLAQNAATSCSPALIEKILDGFTVHPDNLRVEGRQVFKPKQEHRALRRGFFLLPHETGPHLAFSESMAKENLLHLCNSVSYQKLPPEWITPEIGRALKNLARKAGKWFEAQVIANAVSLGIRGGPAKRAVGTGASKVVIPDFVGEIDYLGVDPNQGLLVVIEAKMIMGRLEPTFWRDEVHDFLQQKGCYAEQLRRKRLWVSENRTALGKVLGLAVEPKVAGAIVTMYPSIIQEFIQDIPCISLTELVLDYKQAKRWPYKID